MSGGTFNQSDYHIREIANEIEQYVIRNEEEQTYSPETIERLNEAISLLRKLDVIVHRIDWLLAGDDGEDSFHRRLKKDLDMLANREKTTEI